MRKLLVIPLLAALAVGCGGPKTTDLTPKANRETIKDMPEWFLETPNDPSYLFASATMTSRDLQMALTKSKTQAQRDLAEQLGTKLGALTKQFREEVGAQEDSELIESSTEAIKLVTQQTLNGARVDKKEVVAEGGIYRAYVLMSLPIGEANKALMEQIRANRRLYTEFKASKAFQELDAELEKGQ